MRTPPSSDGHPPVLTTTRLQLSAGTDDDAATLFPYVHGEDGRAVTDMLLWNGPGSIDELAATFRRYLAGTFETEGYQWVLRDRHGTLTGEPGQAIGSIGISRITTASVDIGYWLAPAQWGKGLMGEAIGVVAGVAFDMGFEAVTAAVYTTNERGLRLLDQLGFVRTGNLAEYSIKRGCPVDAVHFELRRD